MFSDCCDKIIYQLLKDIKNYNYSLDFETEILDALENLIYVRMRLDNPDLDKYKKSKVLRLAKKEAENYIDGIKEGKEPYMTSKSESDETEEEEERFFESESEEKSESEWENSPNFNSGEEWKEDVVSDLKKLNIRLKALDAKLDKLNFN